LKVNRVINGIPNQITVIFLFEECGHFNRTRGRKLWLVKVCTQLLLILFHQQRFHFHYQVYPEYSVAPVYLETPMSPLKFVEPSAFSSGVPSRKISCPVRPPKIPLTQRQQDFRFRY
jgi:hypothetical protein